MNCSKIFTIYVIEPVKTLWHKNKIMLYIMFLLLKINLVCFIVVVYVFNSKNNFVRTVYTVHVYRRKTLKISIVLLH